MNVYEPYFQHIQDDERQFLHSTEGNISVLWYQAKAVFWQIGYYIFIRIGGYIS